MKPPKNNQDGPQPNQTHKALSRADEVERMIEAERRFSDTLKFVALPEEIDAAKREGRL